MKIYIYFLLLLPITGCYTYRRVDPVTTEKASNNQDYKVDYLFAYDGCKVYRFYDQSNWVYFTNCTGEAITKTDSTETRNMIQSPAQKRGDQ